MTKNISSLKGLQTLLARYSIYSLAHPNDSKCKYWIYVIKDCILNDLAMDEDDYENTEERFKLFWKGLK